MQPVAAAAIGLVNICGLALFRVLHSTDGSGVPGGSGVFATVATLLVAVLAFGAAFIGYIDRHEDREERRREREEERAERDAAAAADRPPAKRRRPPRREDDL